MHAHEVVARLGAVALAHGVEGEVGHVVKHALVPLVHMSTEHDVGFPLLKLLEQEEGLLACKGGGELPR